MRIVNIDLSTNTPTDLYTSTFIKQGENLATKFVVTLPTDMVGYNYLMLFQLNDRTPVVTPQLVPVGSKIEYALTNALTIESGKLKLEVQAYTDAGVMIKETTYQFVVKISMDGSTAEIMPIAYVPWYVLAVEETAKSTAQADRSQGIADGLEFTTIPQAISDMGTTGQAKVDLAIAQVVIATQKAVESDISANKSLVSEGNAKLSETNSKASENLAKSSEVNSKESETNSKVSETVTVQAMTDYLAVLGINVATLDGGGKLTPSQIPSLSINSTFAVSNIAEITSVLAEEGDVAIVVQADVVTDTYILAGSNPTIFANWKKLGVGYVAEAGHSISCDTATDSQMINGHRVVVMTQAQYDIAVKDIDTVYLVSGV